jgi:hypothetical protein
VCGNNHSKSGGKHKNTLCGRKAKRLSVKEKWYINIPVSLKSELADLHIITWIELFCFNISERHFELL